MTKKKTSVEATSWYHCVVDDSGIPKMPVINPLQALVQPKTQTNYPAWIVNPQNPTSQNSPFLVNTSAD
jgi:hypothetical protein